MPINPYFSSENMTQGSSNEQMVLADLVEEAIEPTVLYIKEHTVTGLRYFGKTKKIDLVYEYTGSGKYWKHHINKHGEYLKTVWVSEAFTSKRLIEDFALLFSEFFDIVESTRWANLKEETGTDGGWSLFGNDNPSKRPEVRKKISEALMGHKGIKNTGFLGRTHSTESREKISSAHKGKPKSAEFRENLKNKSLARKSYQCAHCSQYFKSNGINRHVNACKAKV